MTAAEVNYLPVVLAAIVSFAWGAAWYMGLSRPWLKAARLDPANIKPSAVPFIISFVALLIMGWVMAGVIGHIGAAGIWPGIVTGFLLWMGFIATTLAVNHRYQNHGWDLTVIDGGHWLGVALIMGAIIGWWAG
ncbi:MAG: DUF1761 domain-containing protein [Rhizobiaceae bacterium]